MRAGPSQEEIRRHNLGALLRYVHVRGPISRAELTAGLGLNRSTIGALTADLASAGLVSEEAARATTAGPAARRWSYGPSPSRLRLRVHRRGRPDHRRPRRPGRRRPGPAGAAAARGDRRRQGRRAARRVRPGRCSKTSAPGPSASAAGGGLRDGAPRGRHGPARRRPGLGGPAARRTRCTRPWPTLGRARWR